MGVGALPRLLRGIGKGGDIPIVDIWLRNVPYGGQGEEQGKGRGVLLRGVACFIQSRADGCGCKVCFLTRWDSRVLGEAYIKRSRRERLPSLGLPFPAD